MNRATGLAPVRFEIESTEHGPRVAEPARPGNQRVAGLDAQVARAPVRVDRGQPPRRAARVREGRAALVRRRGPARAHAGRRHEAAQHDQARAARLARARAVEVGDRRQVQAQARQGLHAGSIACSPPDRAPRSIRSIPRSRCRRRRERAIAEALASSSSRPASTTARPRRSASYLAARVGSRRRADPADRARARSSACPRTR